MKVLIVPVGILCRKDAHIVSPPRIFPDSIRYDVPVFEQGGLANDIVNLRAFSDVRCEACEIFLKFVICH